MSDALRKAAQDVIDRWHSPKWAHDSVHTGVLIDRLRAALAAPEPEPVVYWDGDRSVIPADEVSYIPNWTDYYPTPLYRHPAPQSAQPMQWIDVSERVPDEAQIVLFVLRGKVVVGAWIAGIFWYDNAKQVATAWMPLPPPPEFGVGGYPVTAPPSREWVSVKDSMPQSGVTGLVCYRNSLGNVRRIRAKWIAAKTEEANAEFDWGEYDETTDAYWTPEGWYECIDNWDEFSSIMVSEGEITHWMPLPLAPDDPNYTAPPSRESDQPDTWDGAEEWERLAFELCAEEHGEEACNELIWSDNEPWGERWLKYEDEAKRMIQLVRKHTTPPSREWQGLTNEEVVYTTFKTENEYCTPGWCMDFARAIESALRAKNTGEQA